MTKAAQEKISLKQHIELVYGENWSQKCPLCETQKGTLKTHVESVHDGKKVHKSSIYVSRCSQGGDLKSHIESFMKARNHINAQFQKSAIKNDIWINPRKFCSSWKKESVQKEKSK